MVIGAEGTDGAAPLSGVVDEVRLWNYPLDPIRIALMYNDFTEESVCIEQDDPWRHFDVAGEKGEPSWCKIDIEDFAELAMVWMRCNIVPDCLQ